MKIAITLDDIPKKRIYILGQYDFYTRQLEVDDEFIALLQNIQHLYETQQRALESLYETGGKYISSRDKEILECLKVVRVDKRGKKGTEASSSKGSPATLPSER